MFLLADAQRELAWLLNGRQKILNRNLLEEALRQLNAQEYLGNIRDIARIPNSATMLLIPPSVTIPQEVRWQLEKILGENVYFVIDSESKLSILRQSIGRGCDRLKITIEKTSGIAHVPLNEFDDMTKLRVRLAQQLTDLHVTL